ncbi:MAG: hypothetical protein IJR85_08130 [Synergistaceae bacterium]|nr:hypothetical protein [Synergistaceae bacterium]
MNSFTVRIRGFRPVFSFTQCRCYVIKDTPKSEGQVFRYLGKEGIHHKFIEAHIGWSRTFTDAQLTGKKIEEAGA